MYLALFTDTPDDGQETARSSGRKGMALLTERNLITEAPSMGTEADLNKEDAADQIPAKYKPLTVQASFRDKWKAKMEYETELYGAPNLELGNGSNDNKRGKNGDLQSVRRSKFQAYIDVFDEYTNLKGVFAK